MDRPMCRTCPYWNCEDPSEEGCGECRRHAPRSVVTPVDDDVDSTKKCQEPTMPFTEGDFWCGNHPDFPYWMASLSHRPENNNS